MSFDFLFWLLPALLLVYVVLRAVRIVNEYENGVLFRLGRFVTLRRPGLNFLVPFIDRLRIVDLRTITRDVPPQDVITGDNVTAKVNAVLYFRVMQADRAVIQVEDYLYATSQLAQTTLRSILGQVSLDELLAEREKLNHRLQEILDQQTDAWGIKVSNVEIKHVDIPTDMQRAIARQAVAERERRAKVIAAEGEYQAAHRLRDAAQVISESPSALQLRYLQTLLEMSGERNSMTVFPVPVDMLGMLLGRRDAEPPAARPGGRGAEEEAGGPTAH